MDLKFNVSSAYNSITFQVVFGSEEFSYYLTAYPDAFGVLLNGKNIAKVEAYGPRMNHPTRSNSRYDNSAPIVPEGTLVGQDLGSWNINADHPQMDYVNNVPGHYVEGTELNGVLAPNGVTGNIVMTFTALVTPGATNTLTFIIADSIDGAIDSTAYIANLHATWVDPPAEGMAVPAIEPASEGLMPQALAAEPARVTSFGVLSAADQAAPMPVGSPPNPATALAAGDDTAGTIAVQLPPTATICTTYTLAPSRLLWPTRITIRLTIRPISD